MYPGLPRWAVSVMLVLLASACVRAECPPERATEVNIGAQRFAVEVAASSVERARGLSGRAGLDAGSGMLFVMPTTDLHGFWMPDMHFAIDIVWIAPDQRVLGHQTITPCGDAACPTHHPPKPVRYVLEVAAGAFRGEPGMHVEWRCHLPPDRARIRNPHHPVP